MLHRREHLTERIANLCYGRYLPVKVPAVESYGKSKHLRLSTGIGLHINFPHGEHEFSTVEPEVFCCV
jgi:hypothetical protein